MFGDRAKAARMKVVAIPEKTHQDDPRLAIADSLLNDLTELDLSEIRNLWFS
jgi:beta-phosphoglucomutase-like phosphatase (HAD superfamily)